MGDLKAYRVDLTVAGQRLSLHYISACAEIGGWGALRRPNGIRHETLPLQFGGLNRKQRSTAKTKCKESSMSRPAEPSVFGQALVVEATTES